jgi:excisionase family DNA binding protein
MTSRLQSADAARQADAPARLAYRIDEVASMFGVSRRTIDRAIKDGRLTKRKALGVTLVTAESVNRMWGEAQPEPTSRGLGVVP